MLFINLNNIFEYISIILNISGFLGLYVDTKVRSFSIAGVAGFCCRSRCFEMLLASLKLVSISFGGYPCVKSVFLSSFICFSMFVFSSTMVHILLVKLNGIFRFVCDG